MRANPIGVTTLAAVNGPGAYERALRRNRSAYEATYGMNAHERSARARSVVRGEPMRHPLQRRNSRASSARKAPKRNPRRAPARKAPARKTATPNRSSTSRSSSFTPNAKKLTAKQKEASQDRRQRREKEYKKAVRSGYNETEAAKRAMKVVPYLKREKTKGRTYKGVPVYAGKKKKVKKLPKQYKTVTVKRKRKVTKKVPVKKKVRVAYGKFQRKYLTDPRTGKRKLSYMYVDKQGKLRKIPKWAIAGAESAKDYQTSRYRKKRKRIEKRRESAARKVQRRGGPFVPNRKGKKGKKTMRKNRRKLSAAERSRIARKAAKARWSKAKVKKGKSYAGRTLKRGRVYYKGKKPKRLKSRAKVGKTRKRVRKLPKSKLYVTNRRRRRTKANRKRTYKSNASRKQIAAARRNIKKAQAANRRRRGGGTKRRRTKKKRSTTRRRRRRSSTTVRVYSANRRRRKATPNRRRRRKASPNRRRRRSASRRRTTRRRSRRTRSYRRNAFGARLKKVATSALFITTGFIAHKALTYVACDKLICPMLLSKTPTEAAAQNAAAQGRLGQNNGAVQSANGKDTMRQVMPIFVGFGVAVLGTWAAAKVAPKRAAELGGGMWTSWLHTTIVKLLGMTSGTSGIRSYIAGTDRMSTAAAIGRTRRGMRGLGAAPQRTIMPHYAPTGRPGGIQQAVAQAGTGEYFSASGLGEYFASSGVKGVGQYEKAGPLVTQASAGMGQVVDDGVRPDSNLDDVLTLAEAQAGLGEYYSARPDGQMYSLPQRSTWVPGTTNPELWSGTKGASDSQATSELPAGILQTPGGNGIFG